MKVIKKEISLWIRASVHPKHAGITVLNVKVLRYVWTWWETLTTLRFPSIPSAIFFSPNPPLGPPGPSIIQQPKVKVWISRALQDPAPDL